MPAGNVSALRGPVVDAFNTKPASDDEDTVVVMRSQPTLQASSKLRPLLMVLSATSDSSLQARVSGLKRHIKNYPSNGLGAVAQTLSTRRVHLSHRSYCTADSESGNDLNFSSCQIASAFPGQRKLAFIFTGQGAQWLGMGKELYEFLPLFRENILVMDQELQSLDEPPLWRLQGNQEAFRRKRELPAVVGQNSANIMRVRLFLAL